MPSAVPGGTFNMGAGESGDTAPIHAVTLDSFFMDQFEVTNERYGQCVSAGVCAPPTRRSTDTRSAYFTDPSFANFPMVNESWQQAETFCEWDGRRLPTEAEWEYAARGGTRTKYWWGEQLQPGLAGCKNCTEVAMAELPSKVGSFKANPFGLYDMGGTIDQWVEDCWHKNYQGAPTDGSAWTEDSCPSHVLRSGSWRNDARYVRPSNRDSYDTNVRYPTHGFRIALTP